MPQRSELVSWDEVDRLVHHLIPQFSIEFDAMVIITRGGIVPGGLLCEALNIQDVLTAAVDFPFEVERQAAKLYAWPAFIQFPDDDQLRRRQVLVSAAKGSPHTCVLHFNPYRSLFSEAKPDYYAATTDAYIVYPWEVDRGSDKVLLERPE